MNFQLGMSKKLNIIILFTLANLLTEYFLYYYYFFEISWQKNEDVAEISVSYNKISNRDHMLSNFHCGKDSGWYFYQALSNLAFPLSCCRQESPICKPICPDPFYWLIYCVQGSAELAAAGLRAGWPLLPRAPRCTQPAPPYLTQDCPSQNDGQCQFS